MSIKAFTLNNSFELVQTVAYCIVILNYLLIKQVYFGFTGSVLLS